MLHSFKDNHPEASLGLASLRPRGLQSTSLSPTLVGVSDTYL